MATTNRDIVQQWIENTSLEAYICSDCEGIHLPAWESKQGVIEARCFVEDLRVSMLVEVAIRPSAVLPLQGAVHFMNYDYNMLKIMLVLADNDVPRLLLTHALPNVDLNEPLVANWLKQLLGEMDSVYAHLEEMDVILPEDDEFLNELDDQLH